MPCVGKLLRLANLLPDGRSVIVPIDDGLSSGPEGGLRAVRATIKQLIEAGADCILCHRGILLACHDLIGATPVILNLTASTVLGSFNEKVLIGSVKDASRLGATAISVHLNISSRFEPSMLKTAGKIARQSEEYGIPLLIHAYPRGENDDKTEYYEKLKMENPQEYLRMVCHVARIGVELGADLIKVPFTGDPESFGQVVESCIGVPVVIAGGSYGDSASTVSMARDSIRAGASGVSFGRRVFNHGDLRLIVSMLREVVHGGVGCSSQAPQR